MLKRPIKIYRFNCHLWINAIAQLTAQSERLRKTIELLYMTLEKEEIWLKVK